MDVAGSLIFELSDRTHQVVIRWARGFSKVETEEIVHTVGGQFEFVEWTSEHHLRHTKFVALREDKKAKDVRRE